MTVQPFKLALIQMLVQGGQKAANLARAEERIAVAARQSAAVALLPECVDLGWAHPSSKTAAEPLPEGTSCQRLARVAARHRIHICAGLTEKAGDKVFNSAVFIDRQGDVRCIHRKLNELEIGHGCYAQGDRLNVVSTDLCTFGLMICADGFARDHVLSRSLCYMGADSRVMITRLRALPKFESSLCSHPFETEVLEETANHHVVRDANGGQKEGEAP